MELQVTQHHPPTQMLEASLHDKHFMLNFIMSNYLGPNVTSDNPKRSASQRLAENLALYDEDDLGPSYVSLFELESLYYFAMRNAHPSLIVTKNILHMYLQGNLLLPNSGLPEDIEQFTSFFPSNLHEQSSLLTNSTMVKGIVLIEDPITSYIDVHDLEQFRYLSRTFSLKIDAHEFLKFQQEYWNQNSEVVQQEQVLSPQVPLLRSPEVDGESSRNACIVLTGTAKKGRNGGPPIGVVDVGVSKSAYFFQVALPGVRKDNKLSCEVESEGKVHIKGYCGSETKEREVYHMNVKQLCPGGEFTVSFSLPGPVDPRLFSPIFRDDGIFEAVVVKLDEGLPSSPVKLHRQHNV